MINDIQQLSFIHKYDPRQRVQWIIFSKNSRAINTKRKNKIVTLEMDSFYLPIQKYNMENFVV